MSDAKTTATRTWSMLAGAVLLGAIQYGGIVIGDGVSVVGGLLAVLVAIVLAVPGWRSSSLPARGFVHGYVGALAIAVVASGGQCLGINVGDGSLEESGGALLGFGGWLIGMVALAFVAVVASLITLVERIRG